MPRHGMKRNRMKRHGMERKMRQKGKDRYWQRYYEVVNVR